MIGRQELRPEQERNLDFATLEALDRERAAAIARKRAEPELFAQLDRIEAKLDRILRVVDLTTR